MGNYIYRYLNVSSRIYTGFALVLALMMAIAGLGYYRMENTAQQIAALSIKSDNAVRFTVLSSSAERMRRFTREYVLGDNEASYKAALELIPVIKQQITELRPRIVVATRVAELDTFAAAFQKYQEAIQQMRQAKTDRNAVLDRLDKQGGSFSETIGALVIKSESHDNVSVGIAGKLGMDMMLTRLAVNRWIGVYDESGTERVEAVFDQLGKRLDGARGDLSRYADLGPIVESLSSITHDYHSNFGALRRIADQNRALASVALTQGEIMGEQATAAREGIVADLTEMDQQVKETLQASSRISVILGAIALVLGVFCSWAIARGIIRPTKAITEVIERLSHGEEELVIAGMERQDEFGEMARAANRLKSTVSNAFLSQQAIEQMRCRN